MTASEVRGTAGICERRVARKALERALAEAPDDAEDDELLDLGALLGAHGPVSLSVRNLREILALHEAPEFQLGFDSERVRVAVVLGPDSGSITLGLTF